MFVIITEVKEVTQTNAEDSINTIQITTKFFDNGKQNRLNLLLKDKSWRD